MSFGQNGGASQKKEGNGALFDNSQRKTKPTSPDMNGSIMLNGQEYWISGWWKQGQQSGQFLSIALGQPKQPAQGQQHPQQGYQQPVQQGVQQPAQQGYQPPAQQQLPHQGGGFNPHPQQQAAPGQGGFAPHPQQGGGNQGGGNFR